MLANVDYDRSTALNNLVDSLTRDGDDIWTRENCFRAEASLSFLNSGVLNKEAENHLLSWELQADRGNKLLLADTYAKCSLSLSHSRISLSPLTLSCNHERTLYLSLTLSSAQPRTQSLFSLSLSVSLFSLTLSLSLSLFSLSPSLSLSLFSLSLSYWPVRCANERYHDWKGWSESRKKEGTLPRFNNNLKNCAANQTT